MRALRFDRGELSLVSDQPEPTLRQGEALVRPTLVGVCDTDLQLLQGYMGFAGVPGHELVGVVVDGPKEWFGKRVVADINFACGACPTCATQDPHHCPNRTVMGILGAGGAFAERLAVPVRNLLAVPDGVSDEDAVFVEPLAAAYEILEQVDVRASDRVLVLGDGKLGLLCAQVLATTGARVTVWGHHRAKLDRVAHLPLEGLTEPNWTGRPFDLVVEATGTGGGLTTAMAAVRPRGAIVLKSTVAADHQLSLAPIVIDELRVLGSRCGPFPRALAALQAGEVDVRCLVDAIFRFDLVEAAFQRAAQRGVLKVVVRFTPLRLPSPPPGA